MDMPQNVIDLIQQQHLAFVSTSTINGIPNVSPKGSISVLDKSKLVFAEIASPRTISNLKDNPNISLYVLDRENNRGVQIKGKASLMNTGPIFENISKLLKEKMPQLPPANYAVLIDVTEIFPYKM
ncbi:MAG: Pyridoxamine 5'-phosphate oxidase [Candidatus Methanofastidiosum methylothiophilum]|uniref:Pyridoxamine 5'-phosphate oxidase n=1 Tax=Candidatus Methanofastidiosum methylothiophilum TaxID=1705564 RepID=A0A150J372_9EURY|nr:MAG: Pyridoxamine 5'-phosphate oxidase [Candidatus Methanofastidiosum methylthiophilus]